MDLQGLSVICNGLGIALDDDGGNRIGYRKHKYCLDNLKDLLRFLRRDNLKDLLRMSGVKKRGVVL